MKKYFCFRSEFRLAGSVDMQAIYNNTEDHKLYILKLNGFERFPGKLFTSTIVSEIFHTQANLLKMLYIERKHDLCMETVETTSQIGEFHGRETNYFTKSRKLLIFNPGKLPGK